MESKFRKRTNSREVSLAYVASLPLEVSADSRTSDLRPEKLSKTLAAPTGQTDKKRNPEPSPHFGLGSQSQSESE